MKQADNPTIGSIQPPLVYIQSKTEWEYHRLEQDLTKDGAPDAEALNALGMDGWELVDVLHYEGRAYFYFKRLKE